MIAPQSRNDPCPCGSGARYKHCHGAAGNDRAAATAAPTAEALFHRANRLREQGDMHAAIVEYTRGLAQAPGNPSTLNNLGLALEAVGELERAERLYRDVLAQHPDRVDALGNLANVLYVRERFAEAATLYERLFALGLDIAPSTWVRRAIAQQRTGAEQAAAASLREAAARAPDDVRIQANLATLMIEQKRYGDAEPALLRVLELDPMNGYALSMLAYGRQQRCVWKGLAPLFDRIARLLEDDAAATPFNVNPFTILSMPVSAHAQRNAASRWAAQLAPLKPVVWPQRPQAHSERLRIGFVSSDFRDHAVGRMLVDFFECIDRRRLETFGYALLPAGGSAVAQRVIGALEHFVDVSADGTDDIARRIHDDDLSIVIDLNGYTTHERSRIFALRPAPIQMGWLGYLGTPGAPWFDYVIGDRFATPDARFFTERLLHLPACVFPSDSKRDVAPLVPTRSECLLPRDAFVFCCFNNQYKILPQIFDVWMRLLRQVPGSVLWLSPANDEAAINLRREAAAREVDPQRIVFAPRVALPLHLARHRHADLFLDTLPYNAGSTANDALWMGVPVVTCAGETMTSRIAGSQLHAVGLPQLVTSSLHDYEVLALRLATDRDELAALRETLATNRRTWPLFDMQRFARGFEDLMMQVASERR